MHSSRDFHILFVPRRSMLCEQRLKERGVLGSFINIDEYILDLIPYDGDLLSMEYESAFRVRSTCTNEMEYQCFVMEWRIDFSYRVPMGP